VLHMLQWDPSAAATWCNCWARLHVHGYGGGITVRVRDTVRHEPHHEARATAVGVRTLAPSKRLGARHSVAVLESAHMHLLLLALS
jgi:hypothetical protein